MNSKSLKLLIADDHLIFLESMSLLLRSIDEVELIGAVSNGVEALDFIENNEIDILLCDFMMPLMDGLELALNLKEKKSPIKILMLTSRDDVEGIRRAIQAGVKGFLTKNTRKNELRKAILAIGDGENYYSNEVMQVLSQIPVNEYGFRIEELTTREIEILKLISNELSGVQIAQKLNISHHTVESHRKNLFRKIGVNSTYALIKYSLQKGIHP